MLDCGIAFRISDLINRLKDRLESAGFETTLKGSLLEARKGSLRVVLDRKEHTGPVTLRELRLWLQDIPDCSQAVLVVMGFFRPDVYRFVLSDSENRSKLALVSLGLRDYMDSAFKPEMLAAHLTDPLRAFLEILEEVGIEPRDVACTHCSGRAMVACSLCGSLLCKRHFMRCPVCSAITCHSTETRMICFFRHSCR